MFSGGITGWVEAHPTVEAGLKNPLGVALILSGIVAVIAWALAGVRGKQLLRLTLWTAFFSSAVLYLHYLIAEKAIHEDATYSASRETVLSSTQQSVTGRGEADLVQPRTPGASWAGPAVPRTAPPSLAAGDYDILDQVLGNDWGGAALAGPAQLRPQTPAGPAQGGVRFLPRPAIDPSPLVLAPPSRLSFAA